MPRYCDDKQDVRQEFCHGPRFQWQVLKPLTNPKAAPADGVQEKGDADAAAQGSWEKQPAREEPR